MHVTRIRKSIRLNELAPHSQTDNVTFLRREEAMIKLKITTLLYCILLCSISQAADKAPFNSVQNLFAEMSAFNYSKMKAVVTDDFQLLEAGEVWDIDILINAIKPNGNAYKRRNYFSLIKVVSKEDIVWVSYWNKAKYTMENETSESSWLESVVLVRQKNTWKIQLMHSTRVSSKDLPSDVEFIEYVK